MLVSYIFQVFESTVTSSGKNIAPDINWVNGCILRNGFLRVKFNCRNCLKGTLWLNPCSYRCTLWVCRVEFLKGTIFILLLHTVNCTIFVTATIDLLWIYAWILLQAVELWLFVFCYPIIWITTNSFPLESFCSQVMSASAASAAYKHETTTLQPPASAGSPSISGRRKW